MDVYPNLLLPTNSRRRTKGRLPFIDSTEPIFPNEDEKLENEVDTPENELEYDFPGNIEDVDEEPVTIDLSEFLNENPLLTEPSENLTDSGATLTDCHSQFRVTSSLADPTPVAIEEISSQKDSSINESTVETEKSVDNSEARTIPTTLPVSEMPPNVLSENNISIDSAKIHTDIVSNISPHKENILIKVKSSPSRNHKAKSTKATNLLQKYKNVSRLKDFNKNNMKVFGKYPVVKCEKLDIENFIKTNSIKVGNWPIVSTNNHFKTKSHLNKGNVARKYKSQSNKVPKLLNKPITFNRCISNARNLSTVNKARSILIDALAANSSPLIIKTDNWKPEIANLSGGSNKFINPENFQMPIPQGLCKPVGNQRIIKLVHASSPLHINKLNAQTQKLPIITSVNKVQVGPKTFQIFSPNTFAASKLEKSKAVTPILPKPNTETLSPVFLKDYTVIQPYIEDPTSPVKPKPLLTVPLDIVPVVNTLNQAEIINSATEMNSPIKSPIKSAKPVQSVFLNGAINQISTPVAIGKEPCPINMPDVVHYNEKTTVSNLNKANNQSKANLSIFPKTSMIDIVTSMFSKPQVKKQPKTKQNNVRLHRGESSVLECKAYNTTLNDMLFNDDFTDESYSLDDSLEISTDTCPIDESNNILKPSQINQHGPNDIQRSSSESSSDEGKPKSKVFSKRKNSKKKTPSPPDSETLSASEGEEENSPKLKKLSYTKRRHKKLSANTVHNHKKPTESLTAISEFDESLNISNEKLVDTSIVKNVSSSDKKNKLLKRAETSILSENSPESLKKTKEKCLSPNKPSSSKHSPEDLCTTSKSETNSISNGTSTNKEENINNSTINDAQENSKTMQESNIGVNNLRSRPKSVLKRQTAVVLVKNKHIGFVRPKFKVRSKKPANKTIRNKKSSRPADIIKEIKTITGGSISSKKVQKKESAISEKANHSGSSKTVFTRSKNESMSKTASKATKQTKKSLPVRSKTKKQIKTLKVLFKRPNPKQKSKSLELPFDDIDLELLDNENDPNSLSENNTNLNSTFRDEKSHNMGTPSKEEHKCDADVLPKELKSDDSGENILKENELLSNGIDESSPIESSVEPEVGDSLNGENDVDTTQELKLHSNSDKEDMMEVNSENEKLDALNASNDKQQPDVLSNSSLTMLSTEDLSNNISDGSHSDIRDETHKDLSNNISDGLHLDIGDESHEDLSNNISDDSHLDVRNESPEENSAVSLHGLSEDAIKEKIIPNKDIQDIEANNVLKKDVDVSTYESKKGLGSKSDVNAVLEYPNSDNNVLCENSDESTFVSTEKQKHISDSYNAVYEDNQESAETCQEVSQPDHNLKNDEINDYIENEKIIDNLADEIVEHACGEISGDASVSEKDHIHNNRTVEDGDVATCEEMQNCDHKLDDISKDVNEIKATSENIPDHDSVNNNVNNENISACDELQTDDPNPDDTVQNTLNDSKAVEDSSEIEILPGKKRGRRPKRKSCPKVKISVSKKVDDLGSASSQNWYVSERKDSTDSTQSEEQLTKDQSNGSKRGRRGLKKSNLPANTLSNEHVRFETVAEVHAVDTDTNFISGKIVPENNTNSGKIVSDNSFLSKDDASTNSSKMDGTCSALLTTVDSSKDGLENEISSRSAKSVNKRKLSCLEPSSELLVKVKEEPIDSSASSVLEQPNLAVHVKLESEDVEKSADEIAVDATSLPSRRGRPSSTANKKLKPDMAVNEASVENQEPKNAMKTNSPSEPSPSKLPEIGIVFSMETPTSCPRNRKKTYDAEAVIVPFTKGWMRELVYRSTGWKAGQRLSDVYYFSPEGSKLRSMNEIASYLARHPDSGLTIENFTFFKELVYRLPFEIERDAKQKSVFATPAGKAEISNQPSIKKYLQSSTTPKKTNISAGNKSTLTSSNTKKKARSSRSDSDINIDANVSEKTSKLSVKSSVAPSAKKKGDKSVNDCSSIVDTVESTDNASLKPSRRILKKVPFDNSFDEQSQPRPKRGRPSKSLDTIVPEPEFTKAADGAKSPAVISQSDKSKRTAAGNPTALNKSFSKSTAPTRRPRLKLLISKNSTYAGIQPPCSPRCHIAAMQRPSIQCAICLCYFHPNCIPKLGEKVIFACKSCTTQKLALYEKERTPCNDPEPPLSPDDSVKFDPNIDISLLSPEVLLSVQTEPITFQSDSESDALPKNSLSNIPLKLTGTPSSAAVKNLRHENVNLSSPQLLSHLLQPTAVLNPRSGLQPLAPKPMNQNGNKSTGRILLTKETAAKIFQVGMHLTPVTNISSGTSLLVRRLPDGRRIAMRGVANSSTVNNSLQNTVSNANSNIQILPNISGQVNGNLLASKINQTEAKSFADVPSTILIESVHSLSSSVNSNRTSNLLNTIRTQNESSTSNNACQSSLSWDMNKLMTSSKTLLLVFKRLSIPDLLRASQVCSYWKHVATLSDLWERISFQGLTVTDWQRCCLALQKNGTKFLDLRGVVHQNEVNPWRDLESYVVYLSGIEELIFDQITPSLLKNIAFNMPLLRKLECHFVTTASSEPEIWNVPCEWELSSLRYMGRLVKLKIGSGSRIELKHGENYVMPYLPQLKHVALTGFNFCSNVNLESLSKQKELISLELGDCKEIEPGIYALLENMTKLKSLRLENGGSIDCCRLSEALKKIKGLEVLELMNFKISEKLSESFKELKHLIHLNVWPDNTEKAAVVNRNLFNAISSCKDLKYLCWGVIAEGEYIPQFLEMENSNELTFENLFNDLVALFPEGRVEVKCAPRSSWREFCSTRK